MFVLNTGVFRSASTWSFNVCKSILSNKQTLFSEYNESIKAIYDTKINDYDNILLKCHIVDDFGRTLIEKNTIKVIHTFREPFTTIASGLQTFDIKFDVILELVLDGLKFTEFGKKFDNVLILNYDDIINNPINVIKKISIHLGYTLKNQDISDINSKFEKEKIKTLTKHISKSSEDVIDIGYSVYNKNTLFHKNHIQDNPIVWEKFLSNDQKEKAISYLQPFVDEFGLLRK